MGGMPRRGTPGSTVSHESEDGRDPVSATRSAGVMREIKSATRASVGSDALQKGSEARMAAVRQE